MLKVIGITCLMIVLNRYVPLEWWEGGLIGFGAYLIL